MNISHRNPYTGEHFTYKSLCWWTFHTKISTLVTISHKILHWWTFHTNILHRWTFNTKIYTVEHYNKKNHKLVSNTSIKKIPALKDNTSTQKSLHWWTFQTKIPTLMIISHKHHSLVNILHKNPYTGEYFTQKCLH